MKKYGILLLAFLPSLLGAGVNFLLKMLSASGVLLMGASLVTTIVWYFCGSVYAVFWRKPQIAIPAANSIGVLSLIVFLWQEHLAAEKIMALQSLSQLFSGGVTMLAIRLAAPFGTVVDGVQQVSMTMIQLIGFALLAAIFSVGYFTAQKKLQQLS